MSKDILGRRRVARAEMEADLAVRGVLAAAVPLTRRRLRAFGRGVPDAVERMRQARDWAATEAAAWALARAVGNWSPAGLDEGDRQVVAFAAALLQLGSALKALQVARRIAGDAAAPRNRDDDAGGQRRATPARPPRQKGDR